MAFGTFKTFNQIKDEDKYFRFFTKRNLLWLGIGIVLDVGLVAICKATDTMLLALVLGSMNLIIFGGISFIKIPFDKYMYGGGSFLTTLMSRILLRHLKKNRVIYSKYVREEGSIWL